LSEANENFTEDGELVAVALEGGSLFRYEVSIEGDGEVVVCIGDARCVREDVGEAIDGVG